MNGTEIRLAESRSSGYDDRYPDASDSGQTITVEPVRFNNRPHGEWTFVETTTSPGFTPGRGPESDDNPDIQFCRRWIGVKTRNGENMRVLTIGWWWFTMVIMTIAGNTAIPQEISSGRSVGEFRTTVPETTGSDGSVSGEDVSDGSTSGGTLSSGDLSVSAESVAAERLLRESSGQLYLRKTATATFRILATFGDTTLSGVGGYQSIWDEYGLRFRYAMRFPLSDGTTALWMQCCDGQMLQTLTDLHGPILHRVQLGQVRSQFSDEHLKFDDRWQGMGGLPRLLWQIGRMTSWKKCEVVSRSVPESAGNAWKLTGTLHDDAIRRLFPMCVKATSSGDEKNVETPVNAEVSVNEKSPIDRDAVTATKSLPDRITLYLDQETLFPCGVEFAHTDAAGRTTPIASFVVTQFQLGVGIDEAVFAEVPEGIEAVDVTREFLEDLRTGNF
ncbi:MAG: hypothetical protein Q4C47_01645 [Planctomycetia bacterium]|nr:hypothetical protein [Planctomycetia bacterium]